MITIDRAAVAQIENEATEFGFTPTAETTARDYFNRMSYTDKAAVMAAVGMQKGVTALSRACVVKVAELIAA